MGGSLMGRLRIQPILRSAGEPNGLQPRVRACEDVGAQSTAGDVIPIEKPRRSPVRKTDLETSAGRDDLVFDHSNAHEQMHHIRA